MANFDQRLDAIESKLDRISETLSQIAIQRDRIDRLEARMHGIWERYDSLVGPEGTIVKMKNFQASCPRNNVRWVWMVLIPMGMTLLGMGFALVRCV